MRRATTDHPIPNNHDEEPTQHYATNYDGEPDCSVVEGVAQAKDYSGKMAVRFADDDERRDWIKQAGPASSPNLEVPFFGKLDN